MARVKRVERDVEDVPGTDVVMLVFPVEVWRNVKEMAERRGVEPLTLISMALSEYDDRDGG